MTSLKVNPIGAKKEHLNGILTSFFMATIDVMKGSRKASYLNHFYRERLNNNERRMLIMTLINMSNQLSQKEVHESINENLKLQEEIPKTYQDFFSQFCA